MPNYDEIMKKAKDALDTIADVSVEAYKLAEEKARVFARKAKLNAGIANERAIIRRLKTEIGGTYYKFYKDAPVEELKELCDDITSALDSIADKQRELEELRNCTTCEEEEECCCGGEPEAEAETCCTTEAEPCAEPCCEAEAEPCCEAEAEPCCTTEAEPCCEAEAEPCCEAGPAPENEEDGE